MSGTKSLANYSGLASEAKDLAVESTIITLQKNSIIPNYILSMCLYIHR